MTRHDVRDQAEPSLPASTLDCDPASDRAIEEAPMQPLRVVVVKAGHEFESRREFRTVAQASQYADDMVTLGWPEAQVRRGRYVLHQAKAEPQPAGGAR